MLDVRLPFGFRRRSAIFLIFLGIKLRLLAVQLVLRDKVESMLNSAVKFKGVLLMEQVSPLGVWINSPSLSIAILSTSHLAFTMLSFQKFWCDWNEIPEEYSGTESIVCLFQFFAYLHVIQNLRTKRLPLCCNMPTLVPCFDGLLYRLHSLEHVVFKIYAIPCIIAYFILHEESHESSGLASWLIQLFCHQRWLHCWNCCVRGPFWYCHCCHCCCAYAPSAIVVVWRWSQDVVSNLNSKDPNLSLQWLSSLVRHGRRNPPMRNNVNHVLFVMANSSCTNSFWASSSLL